MLATAKVFNSGNSQAIRLPKAFRVDAREMWISKSAVTGEITLKAKDADARQANLDELFALLMEMPANSPAFIPERQEMESRDPFADWALPAGDAP